MNSPITFIRETGDELKKVVWPTRQEIIRLTAVVVIISVVVGLYIGALDYVLVKAVEYIIQ
jgi:preprotein translocase subunit SecE